MSRGGRGNPPRVTDTTPYSCFFPFPFPPQSLQQVVLSVKLLVLAVNQSSRECYKIFIDSDDTATEKVFLLPENRRGMQRFSLRRVPRSASPSSFPRSAWERLFRRSASSYEVTRPFVRRRRAPKSTFPRRAWERGNFSRFVRARPARELWFHIPSRPLANRSIPLW